ncbi:PAAR repeat-containing protein [Caballeronia arvi]|uniref:PAAR repeat-containing protein n=1 Tax=Caballeronia arvi TaxID=1777135 RepID=A0A158KSY1_9BURK|nr:PAAR domain-containing protein [Caballeronia arvi]SAL84242.1 PAAR repeat-containing protein [Caballeronia arvi]
MTQPVILGDPTTHGGVVKTASSTFELEDGRNVALIHDIVSCPLHGDNPIIESGAGYEEDGRNWVVHGCKSQCGSIVGATTEAFEIE